MKHHICPACETVAHCSAFGCVPLQAEQHINRERLKSAPESQLGYEAAIQYADEDDVYSPGTLASVLYWALVGGFCAVAAAVVAGFAVTVLPLLAVI